MAPRAAGPAERGRSNIEVEFFGGPADGLITEVPPVPGSTAPPLYYYVPVPEPPYADPATARPGPPRTALYRRGRDIRGLGRVWLYQFFHEENPR